jgi:hypothetical protein
MPDAERDQKKSHPIGKASELTWPCQVARVPGGDVVANSQAVPFPAASLRAQEAIKWLAKSGSSRYKTCMPSLNDPSFKPKRRTSFARLALE